MKIISYFLHVSSSYAKILGEFPRSGSKAKDGEKKKEKERKTETMASYALQHHLGWRTQSRLGQNEINIAEEKIPTVSCLD